MLSTLLGSRFTGPVPLSGGAPPSVVGPASTNTPPSKLPPSSAPDPESESVFMPVSRGVPFGAPLPFRVPGVRSRVPHASITPARPTIAHIFHPIR